MTSLMDTLGQVLGAGALKDMSRQIGADENTLGKALSASVPAMIGGLSRNASRGEGAQELFSALSRDHDGSLLDNLQDFIGNAQEGPGDGILRHVFGSRRSQVESGVSRVSGLDAGSVGKLLTMLAPIVLGALGRQRRSANMDAGAIRDMLDNETRRVDRESPGAMGALTSLLDTDQDGDVDVTDFIRHGAGLLGKFFSR